ncbi:MAG: hypothetical protein AB1714_00105 [Acidobacteriota bacterium]
MEKIRAHGLSATSAGSGLRRKDPSSAAALSVLHGGLGQMYNGEFAKGAVLFLTKVAVLLICINIVLNQTWLMALPLFVFGWGALWAYGIWDAYASASNFNRRLADGRGSSDAGRDRV